MKSKALFLFFALPFLTQTSHGQMVEQKLNWAGGQVREVSPRKPSSLQRQRSAEHEKKWAECATLGSSNFKTYPTLKSWVLISWLRCSREVSLEKKTTAVALQALKSFDANPQFSLTGPGRSTLWAESVKTRLAILDLLVKSSLDEAWKQVEHLMENEDRLEKGQAAKAFQVAGDLSQVKAHLQAAKFFYEQSLLQAETKIVREKLNSLLFALNELKVPEKTKIEQTREAEGGFENRFQAAMKNNDLLSLLEDCVSYLGKFPGGVKAKWAQEKALEIYNSLQASSQDEKLRILRERALTQLEKADSSRLLEWARILHRRSDYRGALRLSEKALETLGSTNNGSTILFMAGRSAQLVGDYERARLHFEKYIEQFAGAEDLPEVYFRLGLVHLRLKQMSSAIAAFEKLLHLKGADRYELNARYWLARSLKAMDNPRASQMVDEILSRFPMSYYGLRLKMEQGNGGLEWPTAEKLAQTPKGEFYLTTTHHKALERAELLAQNGWTAEALAEVAEIPFPLDAQVKVLLARKLSELHLYPPVVRLVNEAGDLNPELRSLDVIGLSLPKIYSEAIEDQSQKQKLSPFLVRSLIRQESAFGPRAISTSNAFGLMQLIAPTAQEVSNELGLRGVVIPDDVFIPENNIQMGTYYISKMIRQFGGNVPLGLAAYNAGPHRMQQIVELRKEMLEQTLKFSSDPWDEIWFDELPWFETSFYVKAILRNTILYQLLEKSSAQQPDQRRVQFGPVLWAHLVLKP